MKLKNILFIGATLCLSVTSFVPVAQASKISTTVPKKYRGTFYSYAGHKKWDKLVIKAKSSTIAGPNYGTGFKLTPRAKSIAHRLAFKSEGRLRGRSYFVLDAKLHNSSSSMFPENGFCLTTRKLKHRTYKVIRGYQGGYWFDFIQNKRVNHRYTGMANGSH